MPFSFALCLAPSRRFCFTCSRRASSAFSSSVSPSMTCCALSSSPAWTPVASSSHIFGSVVRTVTQYSLVVESNQGSHVSVNAQSGCALAAAVDVAASDSSTLGGGAGVRVSLLINGAHT